MADYESKNDKGECIFCQIIQNKINTPGIFWEDDEFMAFLSIFPSTDGFTVVTPKEHYPSDVLAMPDDKLARFMIAAKKVSNILIKHFDDVGRVGVMMEGTGVDHAHIKLFPMHETGHMKHGVWKQYLYEDEVFIDKYKGYITSQEGPKADDEKVLVLARQLKEVKID